MLSEFGSTSTRAAPAPATPLAVIASQRSAVSGTESSVTRAEPNTESSITRPGDIMATSTCRACDRFTVLDPIRSTLCWRRSTTLHEKSPSSLSCGTTPHNRYHRPMLTLHPNYFTGPTSRAQNALTCVCSTAFAVHSSTESM